MKQQDMTKSVMDRVVRFEERRSLNWLRRYWSVLLIICIGIVYAGIRIYFGYRENDEEFIVSWYFQDWELFQIVWKDALQFIWDLLPAHWVYGFGIGIIGAVVMIVCTHTLRRNVQKKIQSIQSYKRREHE